ncbi:helix-turn-helix domain-containing protein [Arthrobacter sp. FW306-04-A]|uniref:helix-turn-helix domain-containing protein n=1 Tax=Arthrobacter sp. FW306-04-A TaxID=2879619 RepID=UPI0037BE4FC1
MDVALRMGISLSVLHKIERGTKGTVKLETLQRYADALGCRLEIRLATAEESQSSDPASRIPGHTH